MAMNSQPKHAAGEGTHRQDVGGPLLVAGGNHLPLLEPVDRLRVLKNASGDWDWFARSKL